MELSSPTDTAAVPHGDTSLRSPLVFGQIMSIHEIVSAKANLDGQSVRVLGKCVHAYLPTRVSLSLSLSLSLSPPPLPPPPPSLPLLLAVKKASPSQDC